MDLSPRRRTLRSGEGTKKDPGLSRTSRPSRPRHRGGHAFLAPRGRVLPGRLGPGTGLGSSGTRETLPLLCPSTIRPGEARTDRRKHDCIPPEKARARREPCTGPIPHGAHCPSCRACAPSSQAQHHIQRSARSQRPPAQAGRRLSRTIRRFQAWKIVSTGRRRSSRAKARFVCWMMALPWLSQPVGWAHTPTMPVCARLVPDTTLRWFMSVAAGRRVRASDIVKRRHRKPARSA